MTVTDLPTCAPARVVVLASGTGSLLSALIEAKSPDFNVVGLVADRECAALTVASAAGVPAVTISLSDFDDRAKWDVALAREVGRHQPDLVIGAGFMKVLGPQFLKRFAGRVINAHPSLLPSFPGARAVSAALDHGVKITGSTIHVVDAGLDTGPILAQKAVPIFPDDDESVLHERIKIVERQLLVETTAAVARGGIVFQGRKAVLND